MATRLMIPPRHQEPINNLAALTNLEASKLRQDLDASDGSFDAVVALLDSQVGDGKSAYEALISLAVAKFKLGLTTAELMDAFRDSLNASEDETSISTVLESRPVVRSAKAVDLDSSYERLLGRTRIFTDIRPMFEDDAKERISLASINHTLEIAYQSNGQDFDHFVTLDAGDLRKLRSQIDRALEKDENAQRFIASAGASVLKQTEPTE